MGLCLLFYFGSWRALGSSLNVLVQYNISEKMACLYINFILSVNYWIAAKTAKTNAITLGSFFYPIRIQWMQKTLVIRGLIMPYSASTSLIHRTSKQSINEFSLWATVDGRINQTTDKQPSYIYLHLWFCLPQTISSLRSYKKHFFQKDRSLKNRIILYIEDQFLQNFLVIGMCWCPENNAFVNNDTSS